LLAGTQLDAVSAAALEKLAEQEAQRRQKTNATVDSQIRSLRRILAPQQLAVVSLNPPAEMAGPMDPQQELDDLRALAARVDAMARGLERIRYLAPHDFMIQRIGRIDELLTQYMRAGTPQMAAAREFMLGLTDEARLVPEEQWASQAPFLSARALQYLGALERRRPPTRLATYDWWSFYYLLSDPQTPGMLTKMSEALKAAAAAQG
jgi:hypothetical protein